LLPASTLVAAEDSLGSLAVLTIVLALPGTLLVAWIAGRMLGVRRSLSLTVLSGLGGWIGGSVLSLLIASEKHDPRSGFVRNVLLFSAFGAMAASVWIEFLARPGALARAQSGLASIPRPFKSLGRRAQRVRRYAQITRIAARHGLGSSLGGGDDDSAKGPVPTARRLRLALEECGGMFVKMGQVLATRSDLVSPAVADELSHLQDDVRKADPEQVAGLLVDELEAEVDEVFAHFEWEPVAAASIGQAHRARLHDGEEVIVKVQRPGIAESINRDLDVLEELAKAVESRTSWGAEYRVRELVAEFANTLRDELDFRSEARKAIEVRSNLPPDSRIRVPRVHEKLSTDRVLVMEWLDGVNVRDTAAIDDMGFDRHELADELLRTMMNQMLIEGRFHADPHPGNVMILNDGRIGLIDWGATGVIAPLELAAVRDVMFGVATKDADLLRQATLQVATFRHPVDDDELERALSRFMARHLGPGSQPGAEMFNDLLTLLFTFGISLPAELSVFFRALATLDGTLMTLSPGYRTIDEAEVVAREWMQGSFTPDSLEQMARQELMKLAPMLRRLPRQVDRMLQTAQRDGLRARVSLFSDERDVTLVTRLVNRFVLAFAGAGVGVVSVILIGIKGGPPFTGDTSLFRFFGYFGLFCSTVLIMRVLVAVLRDGVN
jgi:ubiquinone biosynthesis protein